MKVFISTSVENLAIANRLVIALNEDSYEALVWNEASFSVGKTVFESLNETLDDVDAVILLWSSGAASSSSVNTELGYLLGKVGTSRVIPVILDDSPVPSDIAGILYLDAKNKDIESVIPHIKRALGKLQGSIEKKAYEKKQYSEKVERISEEYIRESIENLTQREDKYKKQSYFCYISGFVLLVVGIVSLILVTSFHAETQSKTATVIQNISYMMVVVAFLAAAARYAFVLGRSFMVESLRNYDRIHAIKFGEFYLKTYGDNVDWEQIKEAFQHWNIDSGSNFKEQDEKSIDPQVLKTITELLKQTKSKT